MTLFYSDTAREDDVYALPDAEVFHSEAGEWSYDRHGERCDSDPDDDSLEPCEAGYYFWACLPGCLPDSEPSGPYETEDEAIEAARELWGSD